MDMVADNHTLLGTTTTIDLPICKPFWVLHSEPSVSIRYFPIIDATYQGCSSGMRGRGCAGKRMTERRAKMPSAC